MPRSMSTTATEAALSQYTDQVFLWLLELDGDDFAEPIRVVNSREDVVSNGETYIAFPFEITLPSEDGETISDVRLTISNIDRAITEAVREASNAITATASIVLASSPDDLEVGPLSLTLKSVTYNALTVTGSLRWENLLDLEYPGYKFTPSQFRGLF